jgi:hypothetical protein
MNEMENTKRDVPEGCIEILFADQHSEYVPANRPLDITLDMDYATIYEPRGSRNDFRPQELKGKEVEVVAYDDTAFEYRKLLDGGFRLILKDEIPTGGQLRTEFAVDGQRIFVLFIPIE